MINVDCRGREDWGSTVLLMANAASLGASHQNSSRQSPRLLAHHKKPLPPTLDGDHDAKIRSYRPLLWLKVSSIFFSDPLSVSFTLAAPPRPVPAVPPPPSARRSTVTWAGGSHGRQAHARNQGKRSKPSRHRGSLQGACQYRARIQGADIPAGDRTDRSPPARPCGGHASLCFMALILSRVMRTPETCGQ